MFKLSLYDDIATWTKKTHNYTVLIKFIGFSSCYSNGYSFSNLDLAFRNTSNPSSTSSCFKMWLDQWNEVLCFFETQDRNIKFKYVLFYQSLLFTNRCTKELFSKDSKMYIKTAPTSSWLYRASMISNPL